MVEKSSHDKKYLAWIGARPWGYMAMMIQEQRLRFDLSDLLSNTHVSLAFRFSATRIVYEVNAIRATIPYYTNILTNYNLINLPQVAKPHDIKGQSKSERLITACSLSKNYRSSTRVLISSSSGPWH